jgi:hypothetical protein
MKPSLHFTLDGLVRALRMRAHGIATDLDLSRGQMIRRDGRGGRMTEDDRSARRPARRDHDRRRD